MLETIKGPQDLKELSINDLQPLADEVRQAVLNKISQAGGHNGPNMGIVELTVALHYVFNSPVDKMVFDVSHQTYPHKVLTGRQQAFLSADHFHDVTGFTNPDESEHDFFTIGHTSTSISLALGLAKGRDLTNGKENIIAIIGDGSLSGGEALEGLDIAGEYNHNLIIVVNDNDQSIAENHGGLYKNLRVLRESKGQAETNLFKSFGLDYRYIDDGHDIAQLVQVLNEIKDIDHPIVLHVHTIKGKGKAYMEANREAWHAGGPFRPEDGYRQPASSNNFIFDGLKNMLDTHPEAVVLNAGTPSGLGFNQTIRPEYVARGQFIDVGIAEESAVAMASGIAKNGGIPVFGTAATFFQRTYDQVNHDLCLNDNPAILLLTKPGVYGMKANTHLALTDIQLFSHIPNLIYLAPSSQAEFQAMLQFATNQRTHPVGLRVPTALPKGQANQEAFSLSNQVVQQGEKVAIFGVGIMLQRALEVAEEVQKQTGHTITVINPRFVSGLDTACLEQLVKNHQTILTLEDGQLEGGYGQRIASYLGQRDIKVQNFGISKAFHDNFQTEAILAGHGMGIENLVSIIKAQLA